MGKKKEIQKHDGPFWIRVKKTYIGIAGDFLANLCYQVTDDQINAINKDIDFRRKKQPKELRKNTQDFQYEEVNDPWTANIDFERAQLSNAQNVLNETQAKLNQLRSEQTALINNKNTAAAELDQLDKLDAEDLLKTPLKQIHQIAQGKLMIAEAKLEMVIDDIKEYARGASNADAMAKKYRDIIADRDNPQELTSEETKDDGNTETKTETGSGEKPEGDTDTEGQTT